MKSAGLMSDFSVSELAQYKRLNMESNSGVKLAPVLSLNHQVVARVDYGDTSESEFFICEGPEDIQAIHSSKTLNPVMVEWYCKENVG